MQVATLLCCFGPTKNIRQQPPSFFLPFLPTRASNSNPSEALRARQHCTFFARVNASITIAPSMQFLFPKLSSRMTSTFNHIPINSNHGRGYKLVHLHLFYPFSLPQNLRTSRAPTTSNFSFSRTSATTLDLCIHCFTEFFKLLITSHRVPEHSGQYPSTNFIFHVVRFPNFAIEPSRPFSLPSIDLLHR